MKVKWIVCASLIILICLLAACSGAEEDTVSDYYMYYINMDETRLVQEAYEPKATSTEGLIVEFRELLNERVISTEYKRALSDDVEIQLTSYEGGKLIVDFNDAYRGMANTNEVLSRAVVVKTFSQIPEVTYITFMINGEIVNGEDGRQLYYTMTGDDFIDDTDAANSSVQIATQDLYFADDTGDKLVVETVKIRHDGSVSVAELVIEKLMEGPETVDAKPIIPVPTKLISVSVKDGICYVNFDEGFLEQTYDLQDEIPIYAIVNSLTELSSVSKVQIMINGETNVTFRSVNLEQQFERNLNLVKGGNPEKNLLEEVLPSEKEQSKGQDKVDEQKDK